MVKTTILKNDYKPILRLSGHKSIVRFLPESNGDFVTCYEMAIHTSDHSSAISELINAFYPADKMDAIRNNMDAVRDGLVESQEKAEEYKAEYLAMQEWRAKAKEIVEQINSF